MVLVGERPHKFQILHNVPRKISLSARLLLQLKSYARIMVVMTPGEKWTDERLDDLNAKVDRGFAETKAEMREGFARVDGDIRELRTEMNARFEKVDERFDALNRALLAFAVAIIAALIGLSVF